MELSSGRNTVSKKEDGDIPRISQVIKMEQERRREGREHTIRMNEGQDVLTER